MRFKIPFLLFILSYSASIFADYNLFETYKIRENYYYEKSENPLTPLQGSLLNESPFLKNIYFHTGSDTALGEMSRQLFHSVDGINLSPSKSKTSITSHLNATLIGGILYATREIESDLKKWSLIVGEKLKDHYLHFLIEKMMLILSCKAELDSEKRKLLQKTDRNHGVCTQENDRVLPQIDGFLKSFKETIKEIDQKLCFTEIMRQPLRDFLKIYVKALIKNREKPAAELHPMERWPQIPHLPEKILLGLFVKMAQESTIPARDELQSLYQGQFRLKETPTLKTRVFGAEDLLRLTKENNFPSDKGSEDAFFLDIYQKRNNQELAPLGSYQTTTYLPLEQKAVSFPDCGETGLLNFLNTIFRDESKKRVTPDIYAGKIAWKKPLLDYYKNKNRSYSNLPTAQDHQEFAQVVSGLLNVSYLKPPAAPVCEINAGVGNMIRVFEGLIDLPSDYLGLQNHAEKWDFLIKMFSRNGLELDWSIEGKKDKKELNENDKDIDILLAINNVNKIRWYFGSRHFTLTEVKTHAQKVYLPQNLDLNDDYAAFSKKNDNSQKVSPEWIFEDLTDNEVKKAFLLKLFKGPKLHPIAYKLLISLPAQDSIPDLIRWCFLEKFKQEFSPERIKKLQQLLEKYDPSAYDNEAIIFAARGPHLEVLKTLLDARDQNGNFKIDPAARNNQAIGIAALNGHQDIVKTLLNARDQEGNFRVDPAAKNNYSIKYAAAGGRLKIVKNLLNARDKNGNFRVDPAADDNYAIRYSAFHGRPEVVKMLLNARDKDGNFRVDPAAKNNEALRFAIMYGRLEIVKILLDARDQDGKLRVDPAANYNEALSVAQNGGHLEIIKFLIELKNGNGEYLVNPTEDKKKNESIREAAQKGDLVAVKKLLWNE